MGSPQSPLALAAGRVQGFWRRRAGGAPGCRVHLRHRPQWVLPACPQDVGTSSDTVTVLHGTGVLGHPPPRCPTPPCSTPAQGWGPSSPPFARPCPSPSPRSPSPRGGHPSVGEGRRFCPVVAAMVAPSCLPGGARGRKEGPPPSLPSTDQSPPSLELLQPVPSASSERFWRRGGPPLGGVWGGWWVPPSPPLAAHTLYIAPPPRHAPASPPHPFALPF